MSKLTARPIERAAAGNAIALSLFVTIAVWLVQTALIAVEVDPDIARLLSCGLAIPLLLQCSDEAEGARVSSLTVSLLLLGFGVGTLVSYFRYRGADIHISNSSGYVGIAVHLFLVSIIVPFFEELVVRRLLFRGVSFYLGAPMGALLVSVLFGLSHVGGFWIAFVASMILCCMTWWGISTFNRSVIHGAYNLSFTTVLLLLGTLG